MERDFNKLYTLGQIAEQLNSPKPRIVYIVAKPQEFWFTARSLHEKYAVYKQSRAPPDSAWAKAHLTFYAFCPQPKAILIISFERRWSRETETNKFNLRFIADITGKAK